jgi:CheY-like chemotaxis protein
MNTNAAVTETAPSQHGTVLIVEDDDGIRSLLVAIVERDGFGSKVAEDGDSALQALGNGTSDPAVILLDLVMPNVNGFDVLRFLGEKSPHLLPRVIVLTAAAEARLRPCAELQRVWCVRRKPLEIGDLRLQVQRCAAAARA